MNKKMVVIILCCILGGALIGGLTVFFLKENQLIESGESADKSSTQGEGIADGEAYDFEKAGHIKLGEYKGLSADVIPDEEDIYSEMIAVAEETKVKDDTKVKKGDVVNIDFTGTKDGVKLDGASAEDVYVLVGNGEYIDDFEQGLVGIENGKKQKIMCTFPDDYDDEEMAGQNVEFTIQVNQRFGDAIADKASDGKYKTVQEYYEYEKQLQLKENRENKGDLVWDSLKEDCDIETVPEDMLTRTQDDVNMMYSNFAELSGMTLEELLESFGMDEDGVAEIAQDTASDYMISKTIAAKEGIVMEDDFYKEHLMEALGYEEGDDGATLEEMQKEYIENQGSRPKDDMLIERVKDFVGENAKEDSEDSE